MKKAPYSTKDIAEMAGVSVATVSRVINQNGRFSKETEARVKKIIEETNFLPNQLARGLRTNKAKTIGVLVPDITNEFFAKIILEMQNRFFADGYITLIFNTNEDPRMEQQQLNAFQSQKVSGLVYVSGSIDASPSIHVPVVFIDRQPNVENKGNYVFIESDNFQGGVLAAEELVRKGCKNIACVHFNKALSTHRDRVDGYLSTLKNHGLANNEDNLVEVHKVNFSESRKKVSDLLARKPEIDGIFCTTDVLAIGAIKAVNDMGQRVPENVKVVGFDGTSISQHSVPSLTTIEQQVDEIGKLAAGYMIEMQNNRLTSKTQCRIPVKLVKRSST